MPSQEPSATTLTAPQRVREQVAAQGVEQAVSSLALPAGPSVLWTPVGAGVSASGYLDTPAILSPQRRKDIIAFM